MHRIPPTLFVRLAAIFANSAITQSRRRGAPTTFSVTKVSTATF
jgi:hypothetical protein